MTKSKKMPDLLNNQYVLYSVALVSFVSIARSLLREDYPSVIAFILSALVLRTITRNMILVLGIPIIAVTLMNKQSKEGLTNKKSQDKDNDNDKKDEKVTEIEEGSPVAKSSPATVDDDSTDGVSRIDFATTMKQAYEDLQDVLDKDGIKALSKETQQLVEQQKALMSSLNTMAPILKDAKASLTGFNIPEIKNMIASLKN
jgi:hypothetical protein